MREEQQPRAHDPHFGVAYRTTEAILAHPDFHRARQTYLHKVLSIYGSDAFLNKLLMVAARTVIFAVAICLDAAYRREDRDSWPTMSNLKKALGVFGLSSPRRIEQVVGRLVQTGYLDSQLSPLDRRVRLLRPTARMLAHDQDWLIAHYSPLAILYGEADYALPLARDHAFQQVQRRISTEFFVQSAMVLLGNPGIMLFLSRDAGILVLMHIVTESMERDSSTIPLSLSDLSQRFAVSRAHIRNLLVEAQDQDFVELDREARHLTLKPAAFECLDRFIADGMSNHDLTAAAARREMAAAKPA